LFPGPKNAKVSARLPVAAVAGDWSIFRRERAFFDKRLAENMDLSPLHIQCLLPTPFIHMFLGIEIGGTKLQIGVGAAESGTLTALQRADVRPADGAEGIRRQIADIAAPLVRQHGVRSIGIGFGGPVDMSAGRIVKSHHVAGWDGFPLADWCQDTFGLPSSLANDSDMAGLGEARFGAGRGKRVVFYTNVGTGIGGALVIGGRVYVGGAGIASELGHLRPGLQADTPNRIVELAASGWAIADAARADARLASELEQSHGCSPDRITAKLVAAAAGAGNKAALDIFRRVTQTYGWGIAQMITLLSPEVVVIGGGVPLAGEALFFAPLREQVDRYVFPPLRETYRIVPAELGEEIVVHGALALARALAEDGRTDGLFLP
jgi:glucokinase